MKIYYAKIVGYGYLMFSIVVLINFLILSNYGIFDLEQINFLVIVEIIMLLAGVYAAIGAMRRLFGNNVSFEFTDEGIYAYSGIIIQKETFIPKEDLLSGEYKVVDVSDPDHTNSKSYFIELKLKETTRLNKISKSNIIIDPSILRALLYVNLCRFKTEDWEELSSYLNEKYRIDIIESKK